LASFASQVIELVRAHPGHRIQLAMDSIGKEELLAEVARACGIKIYIPKATAMRLAAIRMLGLPEV
jgi:DNA cross-link repair 1B protein